MISDPDNWTRGCEFHFPREQIIEYWAPSFCFNPRLYISSVKVWINIIDMAPGTTDI